MQEMTTFACYCGRKHVVQLLLDHSDPNFDWNARNNDGWIAFILACFYGHIDIVQLLLDNSERIELNTRSNNGGTAFMIACSRERKDVVQLLLEHSTDVDITIPENFSLSQEIRFLIEIHQR